MRQTVQKFESIFSEIYPIFLFTVYNHCSQELQQKFPDNSTRYLLIFFSILPKFFRNLQ